ncbi:putative Radical SAM domain protein [Candidatus Zixiibacteriota bacterium]|nr:putative Radical SAM domain protein [candidate division Zixibacteria bacterium]
MKPSRYNIFIDLGENRRLAFNSVSATLAEIFPEDLPIVEKLLQKSARPESPKEKEIFEVMLEGGYLVDEGVDELEFLKVKNRSRRFDKATFMLTIAPTLACNFRCEYCFENQRKEKMTEEVERALLAFSEKHIKRSEAAVITWFGGEPTLCVPTIERIQTGIAALAQKYDVTMEPTSIITNGYLMDRKMAERLKAVGVAEAQVTLDGPRETHDKRRKLHNGGGTYDRIMANLRESADILKIVIRVNVDKSNYLESLAILKDLRQNDLISKIYIYFAQVNDADGVCADVKGQCLTTRDFAVNQVKMYRDLIDNGFYQIEYPSIAPGGHCGADTDGSFVVTPTGDLFKCWEEIAADKSLSIGNIMDDDPAPYQKINRNQYLAWDPFEKKFCRECDVLPICMGGCPKHGMNQNNRDIGSCCNWKYNLNDMLSLRYLCDQRKEVKE